MRKVWGMWRLDVLDWAGPHRWRWRLSDGRHGREYEVALDPHAWQCAAFTDLYGYLKRNAMPVRAQVHESKLVAELGDWIGHEVLGPIARIVASEPDPVLLALPASATVLGYRPWELARVNGRTWAAARVRVVVTTMPPRRPGAKAGIGGKLRVLAVFSLPDDADALDLRGERLALQRLVRKIAKADSKGIDLCVLQYGATRQRLGQALLEGPGWDVVHLSGHGRADGLVLEDAAGRPDRITAGELVDLLGRAADQIKLVTLSARESPLIAASEYLRLLGLAPTRHAPRADGVLPAVAEEVASRLDCAVLAMRYPVLDEFAGGVAGAFFRLLLDKRNTVAQALARSVVDRVSGLEVATPALFGARALDLVLAPPHENRQALDTTDARMALFPDEPERFVGRAAVLIRAGQALAPESGQSGVVFHGMAGAGKTACALELAYAHRGSFPSFTAWFAVSTGTPPARLPALFARALNNQLGLNNPPDETVPEDPTELLKYLPQLNQIFAANRILLVLDNVESLLTESGQWRDQLWGRVLAALTDHAGLSRVVITSRTLPRELPSKVMMAPVHALSLAESVLLARGLPPLARLIDANPRLAARVLQMVQGHPKLLELAAGAADQPSELDRRLNEAEQAWATRGTRLAGSLQGTPAGAAQDFRAVLTRWTQATLAELPSAEAVLLRVLCAMEEVDRARHVLKTVWRRAWERTGQAGAPPAFDPLLRTLSDRALVAEIPPAAPEDAVPGWRIHPGVAEAVRATPDAFTEHVTDVLADLWCNTAHQGDGTPRASPESWWTLEAAWRAVPYLVRRRRRADLDGIVSAVLGRDPGVAAAERLAPLLDIAADNTGGQEFAAARTYARAVERLDRPRGIALLETALRSAEDDHRYFDAAAAAGDLVRAYQLQGRLDAARGAADRECGHAQRAGLGPWTQLSAHAQRLQIRRLQGEHRAVLDEVERRLATLPPQYDPQIEWVAAWEVREQLFSAGAGAARQLGRWDRALVLNAANLASMRERGAAVHELTPERFNDYAALAALGRLEAARELLIDCWGTFDQLAEPAMVGKVAMALSCVEAELDRPERAVDAAREALRLAYGADDPKVIATGHANLAHHYMAVAGIGPWTVAGHLRAAAVIRHTAGEVVASGDSELLGELSVLAGGRLPCSFEQVCSAVAEVPGVDLAGLVHRLRAD